MDPKLTNVFDAMQLTEAAKLNTAKTEGITILQKQLIEQSATISRLSYELRQAKDEIEDYGYLLCKPMKEIAELNDDFRKTYEEQQMTMADWMVSQKAFKELAIQFGFEKGLTAEETIKIGTDKKIDVLEDKHNPDHNTNTEHEFFKPFKENLKIKNKK